MADAERRAALAGRSTGHAWVDVAPAAPASRISLRAPADSAPALSSALRLALPSRPKTSSRQGDRAALWLGPDEWLVLDRDGADLPSALAQVGAFHSAVDISHRNVGIVVSGKGAQATLEAGCPQDISLANFPVGACSRTLLGKIEIVVWRTDENEFRVECWRSFSDYAFAFLTEAARDAVV